MKIGDWVEWPGAYHPGVEFPKHRGWIVAIEGPHAVVRRSNYKPIEGVTPFAQFKVTELTKIHVIDLAVNVGARLTA